jgi:hypothetical protein
METNQNRQAFCETEDDAFFFDPEAHKYYVDGIEVKSVTQILGELGALPVPPRATRYHREKGSLIHLGCEYVDRGEWSETATTPELVPYIRGYKKFLKVENFVPSLIEQRVFSQLFRVAGTLDRWGHVNSTRVLVDLKTGAHDPGHDLQTAIYAILLKEYMGDEYNTDFRMTIQLTRDGNYRKRVGKSADERTAVSMLNAYRWLQEHNRLPK